MTKVYLKGLGLIGSSLARAIKKEHPDYVLIAEDQDHAAERLNTGLPMNAALHLTKQKMPI